jgi:hypothetical protein
MKKKKKKLTLGEAEDKLVNIVSKHLAALPPKEADERIEKVHQLVSDSEDHDTGSRSSQHHSIPSSPLLARNR